MNWAKKELEKHKIHKMVQQAMNSPEYKEARRQDMIQATLRAFIRFSFITLIYLEMNFRCKRKGFVKFLEFAKKLVDDIGNDEEFIDDSNKYFKENYNLDVMEYLGLKLERHNELPKQLTKEIQIRTTALYKMFEYWVWGISR